MTHELIAEQLSRVCTWAEKDWTVEEIKSLTFALAMNSDLHTALNRRIRHERHCWKVEMRANM